MARLGHMTVPWLSLEGRGGLLSISLVWVEPGPLAGSLVLWEGGGCKAATERDTPLEPRWCSSYRSSPSLKGPEPQTQLVLRLPLAFLAFSSTIPSPLSTSYLSRRFLSH